MEKRVYYGWNKNITIIKLQDDIVYDGVIIDDFIVLQMCEFFTQIYCLLILMEWGYFRR